MGTYAQKVLLQAAANKLAALTSVVHVKAYEREGHHVRAYVRGGGKHMATIDYPHASYDELDAKGKQAVDQLKTKYGITNNSLDLAVLKNWKEHPAEAKAGSQWYKGEAHTFMQGLATKYNVPYETVVGVTAATSPRARWTKTDGSPGANQKATDAIMANQKRMVSGDWAKLSDAEVVGRLPHFIMNQFTQDGVAVARGKNIRTYISGTKRIAFYNDLANPDNGFDAPVDTYMSRITGYAATKGAGPGGTLPGTEILPVLGANKRVTRGGVGHVLVGDSIRRVAKMLGLTPAEVQAGWWVVEKKFHPEYSGGAAGKIVNGKYVKGSTK